MDPKLRNNLIELGAFTLAIILVLYLKKRWLQNLSQQWRRRRERSQTAQPNDVVYIQVVDGFGNGLATFQWGRNEPPSGPDSGFTGHDGDGDGDGGGGDGD